MDQPRLEILSDEADPILKGRCSACEDVIFSISRSTNRCLALMHSMFSEHFRTVHEKPEREVSDHGTGDTAG